MTKLALHWEILIGMIVGAAIGLTLNFTAGEQATIVAEDLLPEGFDRLSFNDSPDRIDIEMVSSDGQAKTYVIDGTGRTEGAITTLDRLADQDRQAYELFQRFGRSRARWWGDASKRVGNLFLRLLKMVSIPLIVTSLATGVMSLGKAGRIGRMFSKTLLYYLSTSLLAIVCGLTMVNVIRPGVNQPFGAGGEPKVEDKSLGEVMFQQLETLIPPNPIESLSASNFLSVISFTILFSICAILVGGHALAVLRDLFSAAFDVMMKMTMGIIQLAPLGVLFLMLHVTATQGPEVFKALSWYMLTVLLALGFHALVTLPLILKFVAKRNPLSFARAMSPALLTAFSSASSNGTLPLTMTSVEKRAGVSNRVSSFVLPLGATINMDGTALNEPVAVLFIAQLYHGGDLALSQQIVVAITALLASIGAAGIPHAGLVMMVVILQAVNLPVEMQGIILAVDRVLDMCRTSVNVWSDSCGCAVVERLDGAIGAAPAK